MGTGNGKKLGRIKPVEVRATGLRFEQERLIVILADGREVSLPLAWYPTLDRATPAQRSRWRIIGPGMGFHWSALDLDLSVDGLISGARERIPRPPDIGRLSTTTTRASRRRSA